VRPTLEYGCIIWDNCDFESKNMQLEAARFVTGAIKGTLYNELYKETDWETLDTRRRRQKFLLFHKMTYGRAQNT